MTEKKKCIDFKPDFENGTEFEVIKEIKLYNSDEEYVDSVPVGEKLKITA